MLLGDGDIYQLHKQKICLIFQILNKNLIIIEQRESRKILDKKNKLNLIILSIKNSKTTSKRKREISSNHLHYLQGRGMQTDYFQFGKVEDDQQPDLPLIPLQSKFSITSQMNPVKGLEMKKLISVNQDGAAEPYFDLSQNYMYQYNQGQPQLINQPSYVIDFNNQQSTPGNYFPQFQNQGNTNCDIIPNNQSFIDSNYQVPFSNNVSGVQRQNQSFFTTPSQQNFFVNNSGLVQNQLIRSSANNNNQNVIFKNPELLCNQTNGINNTQGSMINRNIYGNNNYGIPQINNIIPNNFQNTFQSNQSISQQMSSFQENDFQEKKEEQDQEVTGSQREYDLYQKNITPKIPNFQQRNNITHHTLQQMNNQQNQHEQYMNMEDADYINEHRSHNEEESNNYSKGSGNQCNEKLDDEDDYDRYTQNIDSHTRNKTEWPTRPKGQAKYQQCRHRNIFKNFGNIFRKFVSFHNHFTEKALQGFDGNQESLKEFQRWLKKDIRLENKKDFIEGWTVWQDDEPSIRQFKIILKELSRDFFSDYILIYLLNSKLQDLEIHLRSIGPCLAAINQPNILYKFRPI